MGEAKEILELLETSVKVDELEVVKGVAKDLFDSFGRLKLISSNVTSALKDLDGLLKNKAKIGMTTSDTDLAKTTIPRQFSKDLGFVVRQAKEMIELVTEVERILVKKKALKRG